MQQMMLFGLVRAGHDKLKEACDAIGHCDTGSAVITPGFDLKSKYIIHAVGPVWHGGDSKEPQKLYGAYRKALELAVENGCHSIGFPLLSAGVFGYPKDQAWRKAIQACNDFFEKNPDADLEVIFAVLSDDILELGQKTLEELAPQYSGKGSVGHSKSFDYPAYGTLSPKGTTFKKNPDGTVTPIFPKEEKKEVSINSEKNKVYKTTAPVKESLQKVASKDEDIETDEEKGKLRFVDQPGQWIDVTPKSVKEKQAKAWKEFEESLSDTRRKALGLDSKEDE